MRKGNLWLPCSLISPVIVITFPPFLKFKLSAVLSDFLSPFVSDLVMFSIRFARLICINGCQHLSESLRDFFLNHAAL